MINDLWYKNGVIYCLSVGTYMDANGDGVGDFKGLMRRLDYLHGLGITAIWLMPFQPRPARTTATTSPTTTASIRATARSATSSSSPMAAEQRGIRVIIDLVVNHTSDQHPWFQDGAQLKGLEISRLVCLGRQEAGQRQQGHGVSRRAEIDLDPRQGSRRLVLPSLLRFPARPQHRRTRTCRPRSSRSWASGFSSASPAFAWTPCRS